jgi:hypothetical protein
MAFSSWRTWVTGEVVTAAHMNQEVRDNGLALFPSQNASVDWDPDLEAVTTNPSVSVDGQRYQVGALMFLWARFTFSAIATPYGDGIYFVTLPATAVGITASTTGGRGSVVGSWQGRQESTSISAGGNVLLRTSDQIQFNTFATGLVDNDAPWIWAGNAVLSFHAVIPVA